MITVSVPGKVHLMGEHAVVYGHRAIALAVDRGTTVHLEPIPGPTRLGRCPYSDARLQRVIAEVHEHTPGSYVVTLERTAALFEAGKRTRDAAPSPRPRSTEVQGLSLQTVTMLRALAARALDALGAPRSERFMDDEFRRQFSVLSAAIPADAPEREQRLREMVAAALEAYDDAE